MKYLSVCSGIEAASVAWEPLGWEAVAFAEIEPFPCSVLAHRFPNVPNFGDMTRYESWPIGRGSIDLLVGGTPCQSFSTAGKREGLDDPRGQLMYSYVGIAERFRPRYLLWENVPGVLSSNGGRDFGSLLGALADLGYGLAYRVLDAQWCRVDGYPKAVPQRRRRVFLVGCLGDATRAAKVLFESQSVRRDTQTSGKKRQEAPSDAGGRATAEVSATVTSKWVKGTGGPAGNEIGNLTLDVANADNKWPADVAPTLNQCFKGTGSPGYSGPLETSPTCCARFGTGGGNVPLVADNPPQLQVRRLTPRECERLQGFPDDWTLVPHRGKPSADGPRYQAIGNSMAVNVMRWIGARIDGVQ